MRLEQLLSFDNITIQGHDDPDADPMVSGCGLEACYPPMVTNTDGDLWTPLAELARIWRVCGGTRVLAGRLNEA